MLFQSWIYSVSQRNKRKITDSFHKIKYYKLSFNGMQLIFKPEQNMYDESHSQSVKSCTFYQQLNSWMNGRVSTDDQKRVCSRWTRSQREHAYSRIATVPRGSERSEWASPWTERASEASVALRSEWAEWAVRANERSKRPSGPFKTRSSEIAMNSALLGNFG